MTSSDTEQARKHFLPYGCQHISEADIEAVVKALRSPKITQGPLIEEFESALCQFIGSKHALVVNNGTAALHLAYAALGIGPGDEIITSPITFAATANAAKYLGADLVFADTDPISGNIAASSVDSLISPRTKAIAAVHLAGQSADMQALRAIADKHGIFLIEDAAHALGGSTGERKIGSGLADFATFSFHPVKHLTTGEGGALTTNDLALWERAKTLRHHGVVREPEHLYEKSPGPWYYEIHQLGYNYRLTDIQCALGLSQLERMQQSIQKRQKIAEMYRIAFGSYGVPVRFTYAPERESEHAFHLFQVLIDFAKVGVSRKEMMERLHRRGIGTQVHYIPVSDQPLYREALRDDKGLPGAQEFYQQTLSLPMYPELTSCDVEHVVLSISEIIARRDFSYCNSNSQTKAAS